MSKKCGFQNCNEEINDWQTYCMKHYMELSKAQQMQPPVQTFADTGRPMQQQAPPQPQARKYVDEHTIAPIEQKVSLEQMQRQQQAQPVQQPYVPPRPQMQQQQAPPPQRPTPQQQRDISRRPMKQVQEEEIPPEFDMPELPEPMRIQVKQKAIELAITLYVQSEDFADKTFDEMTDDIRKLTAMFYRTMVELNESYN